MDHVEILKKIKSELFYGSEEYTKNQPDLFIAHRFHRAAPSQFNGLLSDLKESMASDDEVLVYVHLPFCFQECTFCNTYPLRTNATNQEEYLNSLLKEIDLTVATGLFEGKKAKGIYFGGGTPTAFSNKDLSRIIEKIKETVGLAEGPSITCEAHPASLKQKGRIENMAEIGINRISTGCQTFDPEILKLCNRFHTVEQLKGIVERAKACNIFINIDMMTGLPGQNMENLEQDLKILEEIKPSAVEYIRHEIVNKQVIDLFNEKPDLLVESDVLFDMVYRSQSWMEEQGYEQNGRFSDDKQWGYRYHWIKQMPIISFGARVRTYSRDLFLDKHDDLTIYQALIKKGKIPFGRYMPLDKKARMYRTFFLTLQFRSGLNIQEFKDEFGTDPVELFSPIINKMEGLNCMEVDEKSIKLTEYGAFFVEDVCDYIVDVILKEDGGSEKRAPHSEGNEASLRL